ncbi:MAG: ATP-dependent helicase [Saprospiraceae bacterium]|uniref:ATP-dependent helicase n=1 Tax=Candidatus Defluviibacterium haderslevense TaxID=2981993 RepID=A0A9D7SCS5_9BACT|nr:ATP-dependent helicase [Candidatus Defluviibacterium haderslevense]
MPDIVHVKYAQTGQSSKLNALGMREMQEKVYQARDAQYLLLKAPPASGKSRALMFIALDKLVHQGLKKVIVAVPEKSIGGSFGKTKLKNFGFFADWEPNDEYNLCTPGMDGSKSKVQAFKNFLDNDEKILICTHATLRFAFEELDDSKFNNILLAIDEFHHVSADGDSRLGELLRSLMEKSTVHIMAMTGSYFRGDTVPVLVPQDEAKFTKVTYNYYQQLNGYTYLKSLGIGYHFYQGKYTSAILEILDTDKKTILHIPNVNSGESTKDKHNEVGMILDSIGDIQKVDSATGIIHMKRKTDGKLLKIADLVNDNPKDRDKVVAYLREIKTVDDMDLIIALGMAKEGFDWPFCEHALTIGYRGSLTEIIQIIGRCTRDSSNKTHAQFTNLIAQPDAGDELVRLSVNNMLKAITASLLMEQVLAPNFKFKPKVSDDDKSEEGEIKVHGLKKPSSQRTKEIIESDLNDLKATILQNDTMLKALPGTIDPEVINKVLIPNIIAKKYPELSEEQVEEVRQYVVLDSVVKNNLMIDVATIKKAIREDEGIKKAIADANPNQIIEKELIPKIVQRVYPDLSLDEASSFSKLNVAMEPNGAQNDTQADKRFIRMAGQFVNIDDLHIDLIDRINPFQKAFEILSKDVTPKVLKVIQDVIEATRITMTLEEASLLWPKIKDFANTFKKEPNLNSTDPLERRMAEAIIYLKEQKRKANNNNV